MVEVNPTLRSFDEPGKWSAGAFAVAVHLVLFLFLFYGVSWQRKQPDAFEVSLVRSEAPLGQKAPPPPPQPKVQTPPPPPPKPEIASEPPKPVPKPDIAVPEPKKPEKKPPEPKPEPRPDEKKKPDEAKKPEPKPDPRAEQQAELQKQIEADQRRMQQQITRDQERARQKALLSEETGRVADARAKASADRAQNEYLNRIRVKIRGNIVLPQITGNPQAEFMVEQLPSGEVMNVRLTKSSGNGNLDAAIERAIRKSSPLPLPNDPSLFQRQLEITYRPFDDNQ